MVSGEPIPGANGPQRVEAARQAPPSGAGGTDSLKQELERQFRQDELTYPSRLELVRKIGERIHEHRPTMQRPGGVEPWTDQELKQFMLFLNQPAVQDATIQATGDVLRLSGYYSDEDIKNIENVLKGKNTHGGETPK